MQPVRVPNVPRVTIFPTVEDVMAHAAERFISAADRAIRESGRFLVALAGGSTPRRLYELLAVPAQAGRVDWSRTHLFWGDERCVAADDPASNYRLVRETLLIRVPVPEANVHRIRGEDPPVRAAGAYEYELRQAFGTPDGPPRRDPGQCFTLALLGMGSNGHTASLFPGLAGVRESTRWAVAEYVAEVSAWRITLTPPVLNAAEEILFVVSGSEKAAMLHRVLEGPFEPEIVPAQAIAPGSGQLDWLVDESAATQLASGKFR